MNNKKTSFVGDLIIIVIIVVFIYLAYLIITPDKATQLEEIYQIYNITENNLVPTNKNEYVTTLSSVDNELALPIIDFINLEIEKEKLQRNINQSLFLDCISIDLYRKIDRYISNKNITVRKFQNSLDNKTKELYWNAYISSFEENNIEEVYDRIKLLERC